MDEDLMGAEMYEFRNSAVNPVTPPDPRFDPANDEENAAAHAAHPSGAEQKPVDEDEIHNTVRDTLKAASDYMEEELEPRMTAATDYYYGRP